VSYGIKLYSADGKSKTLTPADATVIASGSLSMPASLNGDDTYGEDVVLGDIYDEEDLSVLVVPRRPNYNTVYERFIDGGTLYYNTFYLDSGQTYYTRNPVTGVMTLYSAGNKTAEQRGTWNPVLSVFPIAFWDKMGATSFSSVRLFAATAYCIRDTENEVNHSLDGTAGGSGYQHGEPSYINDDDDTSWESGCGECCAVQSGSSCSYSYSVWVDLDGSKTITKAEIDHQMEGVLQGGNYAKGNWKMYLYYDSSWTLVLQGSWQNNGIDHLCHNVEGFWRGVTKIKVDVNGSAQAAWNANPTWSCHTTIELRAWGVADENNEVVYSIGANGISTVDYLVCRRKYT
jgi:hypothetical protein